MLNQSSTQQSPKGLYVPSHWKELINSYSCNTLFPDQHLLRALTASSWLNENLLQNFRYRGFPLRNILSNQLLGKIEPLSNIQVEPILAEAMHVVMNGVNYDESLSHGLVEGLWVCSLEEARNLYGQFIEERNLDLSLQEKDFFALLSSALVQEGLFIYVSEDTQIELSLEIIQYALLQQEENPSLIMPKIQIVLAPRSRLKVLWRLESSEDETLLHNLNEIFDITLHEGSTLDFVLYSSHKTKLTRLLSLRAKIHGQATLNVFDFCSGEGLSRHDFHAQLVGEESYAQFQSVRYLDNNDRQEHVLLLEHIAPHCQSSQKYKALVSGKAHNRFSGKIYVHKEAQKTDAYQISKALILDSNAQATSDPQLEIFADDVKASHGATTGQLSEEMLFYLQSRGLSRNRAKSMLIKGFVCQSYTESPFKELQEVIEKDLDSYLMSLDQSIVK